jgi:hypothetical protein
LIPNISRDNGGVFAFPNLVHLSCLDIRGDGKNSVGIFWVSSAIVGDEGQIHISVINSQEFDRSWGIRATKAITTYEAASVLLRLGRSGND